MIPFTGDDITLEPGLPELHETAAALMYETDPRLWSYLFRGNQTLALRCLESEWASPHSLFSFSHATTAMARGSLLGLELGYDHAIETQQLGQTLERAAAFLTPELQLHFLQGEALLRHLSPPIPEDAYYVQHLACAPEAEGMGVGAWLLSSAFQRARERGYRSCHLDVASDNPAVRFYELMKMQIVSEHRVVLLEPYGVGRHYRMVRNLG